MIQGDKKGRKRRNFGAIRNASRALRIVIAGGGTGGHLFPGIAIAQEFLDRNPENSVLFVGTERPFEISILSFDITQPLEYENSVYRLGPKEIKTAIYMPNMLKDVKIGDVVALHWGFAAIVLSDKQQKNLEKYTLKVLDIVNRKKG